MIVSKIYKPFLPHKKLFHKAYLEQYDSMCEIYHIFCQYWKILPYVRALDKQYDLHFYVNFHASEWIEIYDT